jgi:flagellar protein FlaG
MMIHSISQLVPLQGAVVRPDNRAPGPYAKLDGKESQTDGVNVLNGSDKVPGQPEINAAVTQLNRHVQEANYNLQFSIDEASGRNVIRVIDAETREVIRQFPMEEVLALSKAVVGSGGLLFNGQA